VAAEPERKVSNIVAGILQGWRKLRELVTRAIRDKARRACVDVPVVIHEMVKSGFGDRGAAGGRRLECNDQVELPACHTAVSFRDDTRSGIVRRSSHRTLVRMGRKVTNHASRRGGIRQQHVRRTCNLYFLVVTVGARMEVRPLDVWIVRIVIDAVLRIRVGILRMEVMG